MMHMWMWFGYDVGDLLFCGLKIDTRWAFALAWIALFFIAVLFEASKVYLARVQREAHLKLYPLRSDERRNLLCEREQTNAMEPTTSRNTSSAPGNPWSTFKLRTMVNAHQTLVFVAHNVVGYLLMLVVMVYNVHLILAVVFGMMLGYFLFGTKLTIIQMQCFGRKKVVICTPECDDTAETSTPPLLNTSQNIESDIYVCETRTCIQPSHYFPSTSRTGDLATCYYGAKKCPSKVARATKVQTAQCHRASEKEDGPSDNAQLLSQDREGCCKQPRPPADDCCSAGDEVAASDGDSSVSVTREDSPQVTCCHNAKSASDSQEQIVT
ncbi:uncharacterized protein LOC126964551 isoform X2 [Leptidea sinapis]|uniref:uncharacterized protein LOC126964551 isoform X2 n=1 Tax=Leptidea sinapis TaxID=189913 RepID=UPI00212F5573|nr:uncharacterized protein LOC126964551 isoform X2 [Leptidea sinapis]